MFELHNQKQFSVTQLCQAANVSRSGYYKWIKSVPSQREKQAIEIGQEIKRIFKASDSTFGVIRIQCALKRELGLSINHKTIRRALHIMNLKSEIRRVKPKYNWTQSNAVYTKENIIGRNFVANKANEKWFTDISYLKYGNQQKAYISAVIDAYDKSIVSYVISKENNNQLVIDTIQKAFENNPKAKPIIHSDRGFQYTSQSYHNLRLKHQFSSSMSRPSKCLDNQPIESFWGTFKSEYYYRRQFESYPSLHTGIDSYIDYYSNKRYVPKFGGLTPLEYRKIA
nr:IS3 family transposase [Leuconostoc carnosum]